MLSTYQETAEKVRQEKDCKRYIYILLLRYPDAFSKVFRFFTRCKFNHASIGISGTDGAFYSYVTKGFRRELPKKHPTFKRREVPCKLLRVEISDETYSVTRAALGDHEKQSYKFKYNFFGVVLCLLRVVFPIRNHYFCSQFVSEVLEQMKAVPLEKHSSLYLPDDFTEIRGLDLCFSGYLSQLVSQPNDMAFVAG